VAPVAVLLPGILEGVRFAAIASLLMLLAGAARPHVAFLGRIPGTRRRRPGWRRPPRRATIPTSAAGAAAGRRARRPGRRGTG